MEATNFNEPEKEVNWRDLLDARLLPVELMSE